MELGRAKSGNYEEAAAQFLRALRGRFAQGPWARRLGYRANPITDWENGRRFPTAEEALRVARVAGVDVTAAFTLFHRAAPPRWRKQRFALASWLDEVRGDTSLVDLAERVGLSRFAVGRWCRGQAKPRLPDFLRLVDAMTDRVPDLVAALVAIDQVPIWKARHQAAEAARRAAYDAPWSEAVLRVLTSESYQRLGRHRSGFIAEFLGIRREEELRTLSLLRRAGVVTEQRGRYVVSEPTAVDTHGDRERVTALLEHWSDVARRQIPERRTRQDYFAYNVCSLSAADYNRVRQVLVRAFRELRSVVAASEPEERVLLVNLQLVDLHAGGPAGTYPASGA